MQNFQEKEKQIEKILKFNPHILWAPKKPNNPGNVTVTPVNATTTTPTRPGIGRKIDFNSY